MSATHNPKRRTMLRGALAAGCVLCMHTVLGAEIVPAPSKKLGGTKGSKVSKAQAKYQEQPKGAQACAGCANFTPPSSCKVVEGKISPTGWCTFWTQKQG